MYWPLCTNWMATNVFSIALCLCRSPTLQVVFFNTIAAFISLPLSLWSSQHDPITVTAILSLFSCHWHHASLWSCHCCTHLVPSPPLRILLIHTYADIRVYFNASTIEVQEDAGAVELTLLSSVAVHQPFTVTLRASPSEGGATGEA